MKRIFLLLLILAVTSPVLAQDVDFNIFIREYKQGNYIDAILYLEDIEEKDAKIYYFLGLSYFKAGLKFLSKDSFLEAYRINPDSYWGRAAYENYKYLQGKRFNLFASLGLGYDSNISFIPDDKPEGNDDIFVEAYVKGTYNLSGFSDFSYTYSRENFLSEDSNDDSHIIQLGFFKDSNKLSLNASYTSFDGEALYFKTGFEAKGPFLGFSAESRKSLDDSYDHIEGYKLSGSLFKSIKGIRLKYIYGHNETEDLLEDFSYFKTTGTLYDISDFTEIETSKEMFLSSSYSFHKFKAGKSIPLGDQTNLDISSTYQLRLYYPENYWYREYWLEDTTSSTWYYWDSKENDFIETSSLPPGDKITKKRKDKRFDAVISIYNALNSNITLELSYQYIINSSTMDEGDIVNYNWHKNLISTCLIYRY